MTQNSHDIATNNFDPHSVPIFPTIALRVSTDEDGRETAEYEGIPVEVPQGTDAITALIAQARTAAAARPIKAVRVQATDAEDNTWPIVVHADGQTFDMTPTNTSRPKKRILLAGGALVGVLVIAGGVATVAVLNSGDQPQPQIEIPQSGPAGESPVIPLEGWTRRAVWTSPALASAGTAPLVSEGTVAALTSSGENGQALTGFSMSTGAEQWSNPIPGTLQAGPAIMSINGAQHWVVATTDQLIAWPEGAEESAASTYSLPEGAELVTTHGKPVMADTDAQLAYTLSASDIPARVLPAGSHPVGITSTDAVVAVDEDGNWWPLTAESTAPSPRSLTPPVEDAQPYGYIATVDRTIIMLWALPGDDESETTSWGISGYGVENNMGLVWTVRVESRSAPTSEDVRLSPDGSWGIYGTTAFGTDTGDTTDLPEGWETTAINNDRAWSLESDQAYSAQPLAEAFEIEAPAETRAAGIPFGITDDLGLITATRGGQTQIYALAKDTGASYGPLPPPRLLNGEIDYAALVYRQG